MLRRAYRSSIQVVFVAIITASFFVSPIVVTPAQAACTISGSIYREFNASGARDPNEPAQPGIPVTAYDDSGAVVGTATSGINGTYTLNIASDAAQVRVEFGDLPTGLQPGPYGSQSDTTVTFVNCAGDVTGVDLALTDPGEYCHTQNPDLYSSCYLFGDDYPNDPAYVSFPYAAGTTSITDNAGVDNPNTHSLMVPTRLIGSTWGSAYQRESNSIFTAPFTKRHVALGPGGTSTIYHIDISTGTVTNLTSINAGPDPHGLNPDYYDDASAWDAIGKSSFGDLDISEDGHLLFAVNLYDRHLYRIPVNYSGQVSGAISDVSLVRSDTGCPNPSINLRPGGLKYHRGHLYVGLTCTAESTQNRNDLAVYVYQYDDTLANSQQVASLPLNFERGCTIRDSGQNPPACASANWNPWSPTIRSELFTPYNQDYYPQPWLMDIEFDDNNFMVVGIVDRFGHQVGNFNAGSGPVEGVSAGGILRFYPSGNIWQPENNGSDSTNTTAGAGNGQGPGGGEFYYQDRYTVLGNATHDEITLGGLVMLPGQGEVVASAFDPIPAGGLLRSGGFIWLDNTTGERNRSYMLIPPDAIGTFGKAAGVGDIEMACGPEPVEIGNRVWLDVDRDGVQDPGEAPIPGVTVHLYQNGTLMGTTTTNDSGEYYFNASDVSGFYDIDTDGIKDGNEPAGILANTDYTVRLDNPADYQAGGPLDGLFLTIDNQGGDMRDSDGIMVSDYPTIQLTTEAYGHNNHTYDFGFNNQPAATATPTPTVTTTVTPETATPQPNVYINKTVDKPFAQPGDIITWTITATNPGSVVMNNVVVTDDLPDELEILSVVTTTGTATYSGQSVTVTIPQIQPGQTVTITIRARIRANVPVPFTIENIAYLASPDLPATQAARAQVVSVSELPPTGENSVNWLTLAGILVLVVLPLIWSKIRKRIL